MTYDSILNEAFHMTLTELPLILLSFHETYFLTYIIELLYMSTAHTHTHTIAAMPAMRLKMIHKMKTL